MLLLGVPGLLPTPFRSGRGVGVARPLAPSGSSVTASGAGVPARGGVAVSLSKSAGAETLDARGPRVVVVEVVVGGRRGGVGVERARDSCCSWKSISPMWDSRAPLSRENIVDVL